MATHSSVLAWRFPGMGEPGGGLSMGSHRVGHDWSDLAAAASVSSVVQSGPAQSCLTLKPHGLQHARPPCLSPTPRACSNSCPSSWWCYPTISSSVVPWSSCPQSFPASGSFQRSQFFASDGQSIGASALASFQRTPRTDLLYNGLVGSPCSPWDSQESSSTPQFKSINSLVLSFLHSPTLTSIHYSWRNHSLD